MYAYIYGNLYIEVSEHESVRIYDNPPKILK